MDAGSALRSHGVAESGHRKWLGLGHLPPLRDWPRCPVRAVGRTGSGQRKVLDAQDTGLEETGKDISQLRLNSPLGTRSSV